MLSPKSQRPPRSHSLETRPIEGSRTAVTSNHGKFLLSVYQRTGQVLMLSPEN